MSPKEIQQLYAEYSRKFNKSVPAWVAFNPRSREEQASIVRCALEQGKPLEGEASDIVSDHDSTADDPARKPSVPSTTNNETPSKKGFSVRSSIPLLPPDDPIYKRGFVIGGTMLRPSRGGKPQEPTAPESRDKAGKKPK